MSNPTNRIASSSAAYRPSRRRGGYAMLIVLIVVLSTSALAATQMRYLEAAARIERARLNTESYSSGPLTVLSIAINRVYTGDPPTSGSYQYSHTVGANTTLYRIDYVRNVDAWTVTADPDPTASTLPLLPASF
ncbi:hypothetical protein Pla22_19030 [Rubripirellula amarantea]|uniref:Type 4 fimbrial biogenesis protein PilX N-terminal domain-containing protein n=1 Tax=Rubripirellula amarantea TaxID=2527999 RepID=A0A5C5WVU6_9BACT|nr:hypothetical protein [Rubripirellula amarantea]TWT54261.1 hypothetical protein Pla22_19030 [Rubripirellula amarantea]